MYEEYGYCEKHPGFFCRQHFPIDSSSWSVFSFDLGKSSWDSGGAWGKLRVRAADTSSTNTVMAAVWRQAAPAQAAHTAFLPKQHCGSIQPPVNWIKASHGSKGGWLYSANWFVCESDPNTHPECRLAVQCLAIAKPSQLMEPTFTGWARQRRLV